MKHIFVALIACCTLTSSSLCAETYNGPTKLSMKILDDINVNGPATLELVKGKSLTVRGTLDFAELDISGTAEITGTVKGHKGKFGTLKVIGPVDTNYVIANDFNVMGPVKVTYLEVKDSAEIVGTLDANHAKLNHLIITTNLSKIDNSTIGDIVIKKPEHEEEQTLVLKGETVVNGDITFESGKGIVKKEGSKVQVKGTVKGTK